MLRKLFGTDGIRGIVNSHPITPDVVLKFGIAAGIYFKSSNARKKVVIAKDTRLSGYLMESALTSGLVSVGVDVVLVGPMPTPAVGMLIKSFRADFGIMISASHNPYHDNGLKLFDKYGRKLSDNCEQAIQELILSENLNHLLAAPDKLGRASRLDDAHGRYIEYIKNSFLKNKTLAGLKIVVDCANGSAYDIAPKIFWELGAEVIAIGCKPNGFNINDGCGSTHPDYLCQHVKESGADIGIALDGDADRVVICDEKGDLLHGDYLLAIIATHLKKQDLLHSGVVVTHASNSALDEFLNAQNIPVHRCQIGDRYVGITMQNMNSNFGGEQSGHIILSDYSHSGDGILASLQLLSLLITSGKKMSELNHPFVLNPQISKSIKYDGADPDQNKSLVTFLENIKAINPNIKILVRKSGTENVLRIMLEGQDRNNLQIIMAEIEKIILISAI